MRFIIPQDRADKQITVLYDLLFEVRKDFENGSIDWEKLTSLYQEYNPRVEDIGFFISQAKKQFPKGCCGLASLYLQQMLGGNLNTMNINGQFHTVLTLDNRFILDITRDQYSEKSVIIEPILHNHSLILT